jgi:CRP/FNR family transcriptional regulator
MTQHASIAIQDVSLHNLKTACSNCSLRELCLPFGLTPEEMIQLETVIAQRNKKVKKGDTLYHAGSPLYALYAVRLGFFKMIAQTEDGHEQITGFQMAGELMGLDAISTERHSCNAVALEDSEVCQIPFGELETLLRKIPSLLHNFHKVLSREIVREHDVMLLLGNRTAEERLAAFLLNLSQRYALRGNSPRAFNLRMTRGEIGSYLGLKLETVSRGFSSFQEQGVVRVQNKSLEILNLEALKALASGCPYQ